MPTSVQPLTLSYSFAKNARQATDTVDLAALDAQLGLIASKINEIISALDQTLRDDNTLDDGVVEARNLGADALEEITAIANLQVAQASA